MALDPSIALQGTPVNPQPFNPLPTAQAFTQLQSARALQEQREAIADDRQVQTQARIQQAADTASINAAVQQFNGDPYQASDFLRQNGKATAADQLDSATSKNNSASQTAVKMHLDNQGLINTQATQMLQAATPQNWPIVRTNVLNMVNSVDPVQAKNFAPMLPEQFDPAAVGAALKVGETHQEYVNQNLEALKYFQGQDFKNGLATALSVAPDQTQGTILGKGDILKSARLWGAQDKDLLWAQQLVQSGAQGKQYLDAAMTPEQQATTANATAQRSQEQQRLGIEAGQLSVDRAREAREAAAATAGLTGTGPLGLPAPEPAGTRHPEALAQLPQGQAQIAAEIGDYKFPLPSGMALRTPYFQNLIEMASKYNPNLDMSQYQVRQKARTSFTTGPDSTNLAALNTAVEHLGNLSQDVQSLGNFGGLARPLNSPVNALERTFDVGKAAAATGAYNTDANAVADEMKKVFGGTGGSEADATRWRSGLSTDDAPDQQMTNIRAGVGLLGSRLDVLQKKYEQAMGEPLNFALLNPKAAAILQKIAPGVIDTSKFSAPASSGAASFTHQPVPGHPGVFASSSDGGKTWKVDGGA